MGLLAEPKFWALLISRRSAALQVGRVWILFGRGCILYWDGRIDKVQSPMWPKVAARQAPEAHSNWMAYLFSFAQSRQRQHRCC